MTTTCSSGATPNTTGEEASAMCALYTTHIEMATVGSLPYADTRQRTHDTDNDGRYPLPCVLPHHTRQRLCRVSPTHAWQKKSVTGPLPRRRWDLRLSCVRPHTAEGIPCSILCHVSLFDWPAPAWTGVHGPAMGPIFTVCPPLPCVICRQCYHGPLGAS
jgi:hypothetical protein